LAFELVNPLLKGFIDVAHLEVLPLDLSKIFSNAKDILVVFLNDVVMVSELRIVLEDKSIKVVFHSLDLYR